MGRASSHAALTVTGGAVGHFRFYLVTANCAYRREVLFQTDGFDESIRHAGWDAGEE